MHEYNSTFVYPRVFVQKRDVGTSTEELEFQDWRTQHYAIGQAEDDGEGNARRVRRGPRESVAVMQGIEGGESVGSPARRRRRHTEMPLN